MKNPRLSKNVTRLSGAVTRLSGNVTRLSGSVTRLSENVTRLSGTVTRLSENVTRLSETVTVIIRLLRMKNPRNDVFELMVSINKEGWGLLLRGRGFQISGFRFQIDVL